MDPMHGDRFNISLTNINPKHADYTNADLTEAVKALPAKGEKGQAYGKVMTKLYSGEKLNDKELGTLGEALVGLKELGKAFSHLVPGRIKSGADGLQKGAMKFIQKANLQFKKQHGYKKAKLSSQPMDHLVVGKQVGLRENLTLQNKKGPEALDEKLNSNPSFKWFISTFKDEAAKWKAIGREDEFFETFDKEFRTNSTSTEAGKLFTDLMTKRVEIDLKDKRGGGVEAPKAEEGKWTGGAKRRGDRPDVSIGARGATAPKEVVVTSPAPTRFANFENKLESNKSLKLLANRFRAELNLWKNQGREEQFFAIFDAAYNPSLNDDQVADLFADLTNQRREYAAEEPQKAKVNPPETPAFQNVKPSKARERADLVGDQRKPKWRAFGTLDAHPENFSSKIGGGRSPAKPEESPVIKAEAAKVGGRRQTGRPRVNTLRPVAVSGGDSERMNLFKNYIMEFKNRQLTASYAMLATIYESYGPAREKEFDNTFTQKANPQSSDDMTELLNSLVEVLDDEKPSKESLDLLDLYGLRHNPAFRKLNVEFKAEHEFYVSAGREREFDAKMQRTESLNENDARALIEQLQNLH